MSTRAVLFDMDGVLLHSYRVWLALLRRLCRDLGYEPLSEERFHRSWGQGVQADVQDIFPRHTVDEITVLYDRHFLEHAEHLEVDADAPAVFRALRNAGRHVAVVTNTPRPLAAQLLALARIRPDTLVGGTDVPRAKPAPDMLFEACRRLAVQPSEALMVGDSRFDHDAAKAAGVRFVGYRRPGDVRIDTLPELLTLVPA